MINRRSFFNALLITVLGVSPLLCQADIIAGRQSSNQKIADMPQSSSTMTPEEMQFANQLSTLHKQIFMMVFTPALRQEAMNLMTTPGKDMEGSAPMSADMAVEEVISNHRDMSTSTQQSGKSSQSSSSSGGTSSKPMQNSSDTSKKKSYWSS